MIATFSVLTGLDLMICLNGDGASIKIQRDGKKMIELYDGLLIFLFGSSVRIVVECFAPCGNTQETFECMADKLTVQLGDSETLIQVNGDEIIACPELSGVWICAERMEVAEA